MNKKKYLDIVAHYESCLFEHGDSHLGADWPKVEDVDKRHKVMLGVIKKDSLGKIKLLDFGCGVSHFYKYIRAHDLDSNITYCGLDISEKFVEASKRKYPDNKYYCVDILDADNALPTFEYIIMNGVFTQKRGLTFEEMFDYFKKIIAKVFDKAEKGIAFNVMAKHVDWEKEGNFHLSLDLLADYLTKHMSRNFIIRNDYGLYEYTAYVYK